MLRGRRWTWEGQNQRNSGHSVAGTLSHKDQPLAAGMMT